MRLSVDDRKLFLNCRRGNLKEVTRLVEHRCVAVNIRDEWDSTPLYYACLCGHYKVAKYLLECGARCEVNTFDGERCLYGALTSEIRSLLVQFNVATPRLFGREYFYDFLQRLFETGEYADLQFVFRDVTFSVHKCILHSRSRFFREKLAGKWSKRRRIPVKDTLVNPVAFRALLQYLYTGHLEASFDLAEELIGLAEQLRLHQLADRIEELVKTKRSFQCTKPGTNVTVMLIDPENQEELQIDFASLISQPGPSLVERSCARTGSYGVVAPFADVEFQIENVHFYCHKAFFCSRSEYFKALLENWSQEVRVGAEWSNLTTIRLSSFSVPVFAAIQRYVYTEQTGSMLTPDIVQEVLVAADICLLPGLKRQCGTFMMKTLNCSNVCQTLKAARLFNMTRLEDLCYKFCADNIKKIIDDKEFRQLVLQDAEQLYQRQDVDTIDIIDNIRWHFTARNFFEAQEKLDLIDELLKELNLDA